MRRRSQRTSGAFRGKKLPRSATQKGRMRNRMRPWTAQFFGHQDRNRGAITSGTRAASTRGSRGAIFRRPSNAASCTPPARKPPSSVRPACRPRAPLSSCPSQRNLQQNRRSRARRPRPPAQISIRFSSWIPPQRDAVSQRLHSASAQHHRAAAIGTARGQACLCVTRDEPALNGRNLCRRRSDTGSKLHCTNSWGNMPFVQRAMQQAGGLNRFDPRGAHPDGETACDDLDHPFERSARGTALRLSPPTRSRNRRSRTGHNRGRSCRGKARSACTDGHFDRTTDQAKNGCGEPWRPALAGGVG
jgi:hypothetical protein